jgi:hypothetical protein
MKTIIAIIILALLAFGGYEYKQAHTSVIKTETATTTVATGNISAGKVKGIDDVESVKASDISWTFADAGTDASGMPSTKVSVTIQKNTYTVGTYQGSCSVRPTANLETNELSGVLCWYAGSGDELGVYKEGGRLYIRHRQVDEGTAEEGGKKGTFETVLML